MGRSNVLSTLRVWGLGFRAGGSECTGGVRGGYGAGTGGGGGGLGSSAIRAQVQTNIMGLRHVLRS